MRRIQHEGLKSVYDEATQCPSIRTSEPDCLLLLYYCIYHFDSVTLSAIILYYFILVILISFFVVPIQYVNTISDWYICLDFSVNQLP